MLTQKKLKEIFKLKAKKFRREKQRFAVEGMRSIKELLNSSWQVELLLYSASSENNAMAKSILQKARQKGIFAERVEQKILEKISDTITSAGMICITKTKNISEEEFLKGTPKTILALDGVKDPGNLGTLIRTADAAGIDGVILSENTVELYSPKVVRSSMGSIFHLPATKTSDLTQFLSKLKKNGFKVIASAVKNGELCHKIDYSGKICLVIGNEVEGVGDSVLKLADQIVSIPIYGKAESLNASVAGGILMYEIARKNT